MVVSFFCSQIDVSGNRKAVVIHVPYRLRKSFRKIHVRLVRELEKKFSGKVPIILFYFFGFVILESLTGTPGLCDLWCYNFDSLQFNWSRILVFCMKSY